MSLRYNEHNNLKALGSNLRMALNPGQTVGPYQVIGQLGHGGMATVYKAYHPRLDRNVAIKVMIRRSWRTQDLLRGLNVRHRLSPN